VPATAQARQGFPLAVVAVQRLLMVVPDYDGARKGEGEPVEMGFEAHSFVPIRINRNFFWENNSVA
jgi:hypothetical protein